MAALSSVGAPCEPNAATAAALVENTQRVGKVSIVERFDPEVIPRHIE